MIPKKKTVNVIGIVKEEKIVTTGNVVVVTSIILLYELVTVFSDELIAELKLPVAEVTDEDDEA